MNTHTPAPCPGTFRQADGQPADLARPMDYPVTAQCLWCDRTVRCERWLFAEFEHVTTQDGR